MFTILKYLPIFKFIGNIDLLSPVLARFIHLLGGIRVEVDALGDEEGHLAGGDVADGVEEDAPAAHVGRVPPAVRPAQDHGVGLHAAQPARLDAAQGGGGDFHFVLNEGVSIYSVIDYSIQKVHAPGVSPHQVH